MAEVVRKQSTQAVPSSLTGRPLCSPSGSAAEVVAASESRDGATPAGYTRRGVCSSSDGVKPVPIAALRSVQRERAGLYRARRHVGTRANGGRAGAQRDASALSRPPRCGLEVWLVVAIRQVS
jgi:hypothetical protein